MPVQHCRHFSGYKPCSKSDGKAANCCGTCPHIDLAEASLLVIHLGALGAVARSTSLLAALKRKYPASRITWVTDAPAQALLAHQPLVDRVLTTSPEDLLVLGALEFDDAFCIDKSLKAGGVLARTKYQRVFGFKVDAWTGAIVPATSAAKELWLLGLDDATKFHGNTKPETRLLVEALELGAWARDEYDLRLSAAEKALSARRRVDWRRAAGPIIGINTGASDVIPAKKWTVAYQRELVAALRARGYSNLVLLGGPEDSARNERIAFGLPVIQSPTRNGLRDGLASVDACDLVITGDSLGMHLAIARGKFVVAWFGPTCAQEIDLYDRGIALQAEVPCGPCWKRSCQKDVMCYDRVELDSVLEATERGVAWVSNPTARSPGVKPAIELPKRPSLVEAV